MIFYIVLFLFSFGCSSTQPAPDSSSDTTGQGQIPTVKVYNPDTGEYEDIPVVSKQIDTIRFEVLDEFLFPPITNESPSLVTEKVYVADTKDAYNVSLLLPFVSNSPPSPGLQINRKSLIAINFYAGLKMASEKLADEGININLSVFDTEANVEKVRSILNNSSLMESDLILGPYRNSCVNSTARFARNNKIPIVSPFIPHENITSDNPFFIQLNPSLEGHLLAIMEHIKGKFTNDQVTLVSLDNATELNRLARLQSIHQQIEGSTDVEPLKELVINEEIAEEDYLPIDTTIFLEGKEAVFIFPSWSSEKEVYEFLRKINLSKGIDNEMVIYGMPQWKNFDYYDYYERLNIHLTTPVFLDTEDRRISNFRRDYYNRYGDLPDENAYLGYDTMLYFGRQLFEYGSNFHEVLDQHPEQMMTSKFALERKKRELNSQEDELENFDLYENKFLNIIKFEDYRFKRAN